MVSLVGYVLVSQAVDYETFTCCEDIICQLGSRMVWVSRMTSRHELWMDDEAIYWDGKWSSFGWKGRDHGFNCVHDEAEKPGQHLSSYVAGVWSLVEMPWLGLSFELHHHRDTCGYGVGRQLGDRNLDTNSLVSHHSGHLAHKCVILKSACL